MNPQETEFLKQLRAAFQVEAQEHLQAMTDGLLHLEKLSPAEQPSVIEDIYRNAHSLKGAARAVSLPDIEHLCQALENLFAVWKRQPHPPEPSQRDIAQRALDLIADLLVGPVAPERLANVVEQLQPPKSGPVSMPPPPPPPAASAAAAPSPSVAPVSSLAAAAATTGTVRVATAKLEAVLFKAEELLNARLAAGQRATELREISATFDEWRKEWRRVTAQSRALRKEQPELAGFLDWNAVCVQSLEHRVNGLLAAADRDHHALDKMVGELLEDAKKLAMLPFATLFALLPKLVHDLCRDQGKEADLVLQGGDIEIDKRILDELKDPLIHLVRNCVDHGIELPATRATRGKPARGVITVAVAQHEGDKVEVLIRDDGAGVDVERLKAAAVEQGLLSAEKAQALDDDAALRLMFQSGVSTSPVVTEISGRGLGLAIVREAVDKLNGSLAVESAPGVGMTLRMVLPPTLATLRGILVRTAGRVFVIPTAHVERVTRIRVTDIRTVENRETISLSGQAVALARLDVVLELAAGNGRGEYLPVIVLGAANRRIAFAVDEVLHEEEVLVKRFRRPLVRVRNVSGVTLLGSGRVVPILNASDLLKSALRTGGPAPVVVPPREARPRTVLVVEDSITARMLVKNILESAGYRVKTAVDGVDAWTMLKSQPFDAVVSDVDMPRMNGFDLTAKIRADKALAELPVVLLTALASREDRERGVEAGATAYLVKSSFDQSNLLDILQRVV